MRGEGLDGMGWDAGDARNCLVEGWVGALVVVVFGVSSGVLGVWFKRVPHVGLRFALVKGVGWRCGWGMDSADTMR